MLAEMKIEAQGAAFSSQCTFWLKDGKQNSARAIKTSAHQGCEDPSNPAAVGRRRSHVGKCISLFAR
jgi:hypothetical protein